MSTFFDLVTFVKLNVARFFPPLNETVTCAHPDFRIGAYGIRDDERARALFLGDSVVTDVWHESC